MESFISIGAVIIVALVGVIYLAYKLFSRATDSVVPISDVSEISRLKREFMTKQSGAAVSPQVSPVDYQETAILKDQMMTIEEESTQLRNQVSILEKEKVDLKQAGDKLSESEVIIQALKKDNEDLQRRTLEQERNSLELTKDISQIKSELAEAKHHEITTLASWELEISQLQKEKEELLRGRLELDLLKKENMVLQDQDGRLASKYRRLIERFSVLRKRASEYKDVTVEHIEDLENENRFLKEKNIQLEEIKSVLEKQMVVSNLSTHDSIGL
ncbi:MAG: chromosome segregation ATPase, partial [Candidatus Omnitrophota bacterium]